MRSKPMLFGLLLVLSLASIITRAGHAQNSSAKNAETVWHVPPSKNKTPHFEQVNGHKRLYVDGRPFTALAVEIPWWDLVYGKYHETEGAYDYLYPAAEALHLNTLKVPVKWSMVEPDKPGEYDFSYIDHVKRLAEDHHLKLVLNWFGHYASDDGTIYINLSGNVFAPMYVINDEKTYPRAVDGDGQVHHNAASYDSDAIIEREILAFRAFMDHIREVDSKTHTIIMIQVENEIAIFGVDRGNRKQWRDHSPASNRRYEEHHFADDLKFSAWDLSYNWIRRLTEAGTDVYPLPFFHNFVGGELQHWMVGGSPGEDLETYLENCPNLSFIGVNSYFCEHWRDDNSCETPSRATLEELREPLKRYSVGRNLPAITETNSGNSWVASRLAFVAVGEFAAPLFAPWALTESYPESYEPYVLKDGAPANGAAKLKETYSSIGLATSLIAYYAGTDRLKVFMAASPNERHNQDTQMAGAELTVSQEDNGQAMILSPAEHKLLIVGYRTGVSIKSSEFVWPALKNLRVQRGFWDGDQWTATGEAQYGIDQSHSTVFVGVEEPGAIRVEW